MQIVLLSVTVAILTAGVVFFPFLGISAGGVRHADPICDTAPAQRSNNWLGASPC